MPSHCGVSDGENRQNDHRYYVRTREVDSLSVPSADWHSSRYRRNGPSPRKSHEAHGGKANCPRSKHFLFSTPGTRSLYRYPRIFGCSPHCGHVPPPLFSTVAWRLCEKSMAISTCSPPGGGLLRSRYIIAI